MGNYATTRSGGDFFHYSRAPAPDPKPQLQNAGGLFGADRRSPKGPGGRDIQMSRLSSERERGGDREYLFHGGREASLAVKQVQHSREV